MGEEKDEKGIVVSCKNEKYQLPTGKKVVAIDVNYFRPTEVDLLIGDATKAREKLGWQPTYSLAEMVKEMVISDLETYKMSQDRKYFL
jgi:GDPmannose 4,6-dehydratase